MGPITVTCLQEYFFPFVANTNFLLSSPSLQSLKDGFLSGVNLMHEQFFRNRILSDSIFSALVGMDLFFFLSTACHFFDPFFFRCPNNHKINDKYWPIFNGWSNNLMDFLFKNISPSKKGTDAVIRPWQSVKLNIFLQILRMFLSFFFVVLNKNYTPKCLTRKTRRRGASSKRSS